MSAGDFWARRKAAVEAGEAAESAAADDRRYAAERATLEEKSDADILAELDLPDPDSLELGDDVRGFMNRAVPDRLRRRALRQLWKLNPVLANVDGLVDYGEDFTDSALVVENLQTAYQVGKGMLAHVEALAQKADAAAQAADAEPETAEDTAPGPQPPEIETALADAAPAEEIDAASQHLSQPADAAETQENQSDTRYAAVSPRRMRFAFDE